MRFGLSVLVIFMVCSSTGFASSRSQRARGASIFAASGCSHCHSIRNVGGHKGPDLSGVGRRLEKDQMRKQIVTGSKRMPPFGETLQEAEIADVIAYLRSCQDRQKK
jgi:ubiquinol-cytochrome c reductase cytochrome b subunit